MKKVDVLLVLKESKKTDKSCVVTKSLEGANFHKNKRTLRSHGKNKVRGSVFIFWEEEVLKFQSSVLEDKPKVSET